MDHINFKFSEELKNKPKLKSDKSHIIKIFSLEEFEIQKIFLEEVEKKPKERDYLLIINYPNIKELPKEYSIVDKNPYYYGLKETNNILSFNILYNNERIKVFQNLEFFYKYNKKNLFYLLSIKNLTELNNFKYSDFNNHFKNIPLDLFRIELFDNKPGIKSIEFKII